MFLSCRPLVVITTLPTGLVGVDNVVITTKGPQDKNINILDGTTVENKGKLILTILSCLDLCYLISLWIVFRLNPFLPAISSMNLFCS